MVISGENTTTAIVPVGSRDDMHWFNFDLEVYVSQAALLRELEERVGTDRERGMDRYFLETQREVVSAWAAIFGLGLGPDGWVPTREQADRAWRAR